MHLLYRELKRACLMLQDIGFLWSIEKKIHFVKIFIDLIRF